MSYPKFKYHPEFEPFVVKTEAEEKKLGKGWVDSPAQFGVETAPARIVKVDTGLPQRKQKNEAQR